MKKILIISLNSGGTMGHGRIITSLANLLYRKNKQIVIMSDVSFLKNFQLNQGIIIKKIKKTPHINYTIGGMCNHNQKDEIYEYVNKNSIECVIFSTFFDLDLIKRLKKDKIKTILLSYPIRDTYRLALKQRKAFLAFDKVLTLYGPSFQDKIMSNEVLTNPLKTVYQKPKNTEKIDILITCGGGGRPSSKLFMKKISLALKKLTNQHKGLKVTIIKGNSKVKTIKKGIHILSWTQDFNSLIRSSKVIISEAGYFTMLDLINYKKKAILIPGERIIDNQEIRALKLEKLGIGRTFFPFEGVQKLYSLINKELKSINDNGAFKKILNRFNRYPELGKVIMSELK